MNDLRLAFVVPKDKRVYAAVAARWVPEERAELLELSRRFDFERDGVSLALTEFGGTATK